MIDNYISVIKRYSVFSGRAGRKEYWYFYLANIIIGVALGLVMLMMGSSSKSFITVMVVAMILGLAVMVPSIAVTVRRLHDTNRSGWWFLISFVPYIGGIILLVLMILDSTLGDNKYGPNPKGTPAS